MNENDLRVVKTRENIESTFLKLLEEKSFSQITVGELISLCRISKGTFYYHYCDKYDLAEKILRKQFIVYDEVLANSQRAMMRGDGSVEQYVSLLMEAADIFVRLSSIQTTEFDAKKESMEFLTNKFLAHFSRWADVSIKYPMQVARYLAAIVIAEAEMVCAGKAQAGPQFFETLQELVMCIGQFQKRNL